jgi:hypothetical protein
VCTGHCTVQCPVHRQPRAKNPFFLCAVRWFTGQVLCAVRCAPDRHYRLSGAPISRFKKRPPARDRARGSFRQPSFSVTGDFSPHQAIHHLRRPLSSTVLRRHRAPLLPPLGEQLWLPLPPLYFFFEQSTPFHLFCPNSNSCEIQCNQVVFCVPLYSLNTPAGS